MRIVTFLIIASFSLGNFALAHEAGAPTLDERIREASISIVTLAGILITLLVILSVAKMKKEPVEEGLQVEPSGGPFKWTVFLLIAILALGTTFFLSGSTIYLNMKSATGGPVHWHADFMIFNCGREVFLTEPKGLSNKIGTPVLHEHGDKRVHVEGVVVDMEEVSLHRFFEVIGGSLTKGMLVVPVKGGLSESMKNGERCAEDTPHAGKSAFLNVFLYKTEGNAITQSKLENYSEYILSGHSQIPPGDCIIFEYAPELKEKTDKICNFTSIAIKEGKYKYIK